MVCGTWFWIWCLGDLGWAFGLWSLGLVIRFGFVVRFLVLVFIGLGCDGLYTVCDCGFGLVFAWFGWFGCDCGLRDCFWWALGWSVVLCRFTIHGFLLLLVL